MHRPKRDDDHRDEDQRLSARHAPLCRASPLCTDRPFLARWQIARAESRQRLYGSRGVVQLGYVPWQTTLRIA